MGVKKTFAQLTEDLEKLQKSAEEPTKEVTAEEPVAPVEEPEVVEPAKEEPVVEEPAKEEPKAEEPIEEPVAKSDDEKSKKEDKEEDDEDEDKEKEKAPKDKKDKEDKEDKKEEKEEVKKSEDSLTGEDFLKAFQAIHKSLGTLPSEMAEIKKSLADVLELVNSLMKEEPVSKSEEVVEEITEAPAEESTTEEEEVTEVEEEVEKSVEQPVEEEEELHGKAVEYVSKSNGIPEIEGEPVVEEEAEVEFNPLNHVDQVTDYYMAKSQELTPGEKSAFRGAVQRVKRGQATETDIGLFKQVADFYEN